MQFAGYASYLLAPMQIVVDDYRFSNSMPWIGIILPETIFVHDAMSML